MKHLTVLIFITWSRLNSKSLFIRWTEAREVWSFPIRNKSWRKTPNEPLKTAIFDQCCVQHTRPPAYDKRCWVIITSAGRQGQDENWTQPEAMSAGWRGLAKQEAEVCKGPWFGQFRPVFFRGKRTHRHKMTGFFRPKVVSKKEKNRDHRLLSS